VTSTATAAGVKFPLGLPLAAIHLIVPAATTIKAGIDPQISGEPDGRKRNYCDNNRSNYESPFRARQRAKSHAFIHEFY